MGKNRLSTGTFSFSDLENGADYSAKSIGAEYHHYGSYDKMSRQEKNKVYNTIGLSPSLSMPAKGDANSTTTSAVAAGTIDIRENPGQDISALDRAMQNTLNELGRIFDKQKIEEQQELAKVFGEEAFRLAHNLPDDGSGRKVAVHAIIGGIMSQITGTGFASGAIGAGVNEAIIGEIKKIKDPGTAQIVSAIVGAAAAKAVGGNAGSGASAAASGTKSNAYRERPNYEGAFVVRNNRIFIISNGEEIPYEGDIPYNAYFWVEDSNAPWYGWDYKRTDVGDFYEPRIPTHMFYFSHEDRIYGLTFLDDTNGQKKAELNMLGSKLADSMLDRLVGGGPFITIPKTLISGAKNKNWDIDPRDIPSKLDDLVDTIKEYVTDD